MALLGSQMFHDVRGQHESHSTVTEEGQENQTLPAQSTTTDYIRAKTHFNLSPIYYAHKSSNHKFFKNKKITPDTNLHRTKHTQTSNTEFSKN